MRKYTLLKTGGKAKLFCAENLSELASFTRNYEFHIMGSGSHILAGNQIKRVILKLGKAFERISYSDKKLTVGAAALKSTLAKFALQNGIGDFEFLATLPGTIGSAIAMNTSSYGSGVSDLVDKAVFIDENGELITLSCNEIGFANGCNSLPDNYVCIEAIFNVERLVSQEEIKLLTLEMLRKRHESQPMFSETACKIFIDPIGSSASSIVEEAGYKGFSIGNAKISEADCNFIINGGCETPDPLIELCYVVRDGVKKKLGIELEFAILFI